MTTAIQATDAALTIGYYVEPKSKGYLVGNGETAFYVNNVADLLEWVEAALENASCGMFKGE